MGRGQHIAIYLLLHCHLQSSNGRIWAKQMRQSFCVIVRIKVPWMQILIGSYLLKPSEVFLIVLLIMFFTFKFGYGTFCFLFCIIFERVCPLHVHLYIPSTLLYYEYNANYLFYSLEVNTSLCLQQRPYLPGQFWVVSWPQIVCGGCHSWIT